MGKNATLHSRDLFARVSDTMAAISTLVGASVETPLNILHISLEDFSTLASPIFSSESSPDGGSGFAMPSTPHIASLAGRAVVFRRTYCQAPICNPSRTSIMTGRRPGTTRVFTNDDPYHERVTSSMPTLVGLLKAAAPEASVACASGSKLFHIACDHDAMGFDMGTEAEPDIASLPFAVRSAAAFILSPPSPASADQHRARVALRRLVEYARAPRRFYLGVGFVETHAYNQHVCHLEVVPHGRLAAHSPPSRAMERLPPLLTHPNFDFWRTASDEERRRAIGAYYSCATHVDGTIGALIASLDALGLASTTAVVLHGDHGYSLGRHGRWSKYNLYEDATRVPLLIAVPGGRARLVDDVVESIDVLPTILDLFGVGRAGLPSPAEAEADEAASLLRARRRMQSSAASVVSVSASAAPPSHLQYTMHGVAIPLDGESLVPFLRPSSDGDMRPGGARRRRRYARSELHLPCGLGCCMLNQPYDGLPPGYTRTPTVGPVVQLYVRTRRWAYTATFLGVLDPLRNPARSPLRLIDEALFDTNNDSGEARNLAYFGRHARPLLTLRWSPSLTLPCRLIPHLPLPSPTLPATRIRAPGCCKLYSAIGTSRCAGPLMRAAGNARRRSACRQATAEIGGNDAPRLAVSGLHGLVDRLWTVPLYIRLSATFRGPNSGISGTSCSL